MSSIDEAVQAVGLNQGQPGMLKPEDIIAAEEAANKVAKEAAEKGAQPEPTPPVEPPRPAEPVKVDLEALANKIENGEELTSEEAEEWRKIEKETQPAPPPPTYKIAGKEYNYEEMKIRAMQDYGLAGVKVTTDYERKIVDDYVRAQNKEAQGIAVEKRQEEVVKQRKEVEEAQRHVVEQRIRVETDRELVKRERQRVTKRLTELQALASLPVTEEQTFDPETGRTNPIKLLELQRKTDALNQIPELQTEAQSLEREEIEKETQLDKIMFESFQGAHSHYKTSEPIPILLQKRRMGQTLSADDDIKLAELEDIFTTAKQRGCSMDTIYNLLEKRNSLAVKPSAAHSVTPTEDEGQNNEPQLVHQRKTKAAKIRELIEKNKKLPPSTPPQGGGDRRSTDNAVPTADEIMEHDRKVLRGGSSGLLKELGYS